MHPDLPERCATFTVAAARGVSREGEDFATRVLVERFFFFLILASTSNLKTRSFVERIGRGMRLDREKIGPRSVPSLREPFRHFPEKATSQRCGARKVQIIFGVFFRDPCVTQ